VWLGNLTGPQTIEAVLAQPGAPDVRAVFEVTALSKHGHGD
jgi:hypothetical protein